MDRRLVASLRRVFQDPRLLILREDFHVFQLKLHDVLPEDGGAEEQDEHQGKCGRSIHFTDPFNRIEHAMVLDQGVVLCCRDSVSAA